MAKLLRVVGVTVAVSGLALLTACSSGAGDNNAPFVATGSPSPAVTDTNSPAPTITPSYSPTTSPLPATPTPTPASQ